MKKVLIFYKPEHADLATELRDNYRAHDHLQADIVSTEEHDDIEYAEKMQYDEAVFIENRDTVTYHDIGSGYTGRLPVPDVFYSDPKPESYKAATNYHRQKCAQHAGGGAAVTWKCPKCGREFTRRDQDHYCVRPQTVDDYIALQDEAVRPRLREARAVLKNALPEAEERISWSMPTYRKGRNIIHFAASKNHLGIYPGEEAVAEFAQELSGFSVSKGTIRIPYDQPLPAALIERIARWCFEKYAR